MLPVWTVAAKKVKETLKAREVPYLAVGAALSFVIMMLNVPIPGLNARPLAAFAASSRGAASDNSHAAQARG